MLGDTKFEDCLTEFSPNQLQDVNLNILINKDGKYGVRPISIVNPFLYYFLVRELCNESAWEKIKDLFSKYQVPNITSSALPILKQENEVFNKSTIILNWWHTIEQRSLELSLEYKSMFMTDITNCYGTINTQTIKDALSLFGTEHYTEENDEIADNIILYLKAMQQGK